MSEAETCSEMKTFTLEEMLTCPPPDEYQGFNSVNELVQAALDPKRKWEFNRGQYCQVNDQVYVLLQVAAGNHVCTSRKCLGSFIVQRIAVREPRHGHGSRFLHELSLQGCVYLQSALSASGLALGHHMVREHQWCTRHGLENNFYSPCHKA